MGALTDCVSLTSRGVFRSKDTAPLDIPRQTPARVGLDGDIEALKGYRRSSAFDADALWHHAHVRRVATVIRSYLDMIP